MVSFCNDDEVLLLGVWFWLYGYLYCWYDYWFGGICIVSNVCGYVKCGEVDGFDG